MKSELRKYKILFAAVLLLFGSTLAFLFFYTITSDTEIINKLALEQAKASYNKDLVYRRWASVHGGVYVPITDSTQPNDYLKVKNREITDTNGKKYTLINPAYMTRQVHAIGMQQYKTKGHITSLDPINPINKADKWENKVLKMFGSGKTEFSEEDTLNGEIYLRYMGAMITEQSCLKCHSEQGYKVGDIRGGISISVPLAKYNQINRHEKLRHVVTFLGLFIICGVLLFFVYKKLINELIKKKLAEKLRLENAENHKQIIQSALNGFLITNTSGAIQEVNPSYCKMSGYSEEELLKMNLTDLEINLNINDLKTRIQNIIPHKVGRYESQHKKKDGSPFNIEVSAIYIPSDGGRFVNIIEDTTERKKFQQELINAKEIAENKESKLRFITENIHDVIWIFDTEEARFSYVSPSVEKMQGFTPEEFLAAPFDAIMPQESVQQLIILVKKRLDEFKKTKQKRGYVDQMKLLNKNGKEIWVEIVSFYQKNPKTDRIESIGTTRNIDLRKNTELALKKSEQQYRLLFENMNEAFALHKIILNEKNEPVDYVFIDVNSKFEEYTQLKKENILGKTVLEIMPKTEKYWIERYGRVALSQIPEEFIEFSAELNSYYNVKAYSPQPEYFAATFADVSFEKKAENLLIESEEKFKNRFEYFPFPTFIWQRIGDDFEMTSANKAAYEQSNGGIENVFGIKSKILWKDEPELSDYLFNSFNSKSSFTIERYYYFRGSKKGQYVSTTYSFLPPDKVQIITMDITDRKIAEQEVRNQKKLFETMFNTISDGVIIADTNRNILMANDGTKNTFGHQPVALIGQSTKMLYADVEKYSESGEKVFNESAKNTKSNYITYYKDIDGNIFPGETFGSKLYDNSGTWIGNLAIIRNISERMKMISDLLKAKEKAEESENKYRNLVETAQELIWKCDTSGKFTYLNNAWEQTHGYKIEEMLGKGFYEFQQNEIYLRDQIELTKKLADGIIKNYETTFIAKDGRELTLLVNAIPIIDAESNIVGAQGTATDITERKLYEKELENHRNNLEILVQERTDELEAASDELRANLEELLITKELLLKSEDVLNEVQTLGNIGGWSYDVKTQLTWWTKGLFEIHELPFDRHSDEVEKKLNKSINCLPENKKKLALKSFHETITKGKSYLLEHKFTTYKGKEIWVKNVGKPIIENGEVIRVVGALIDITEQKNAAMQLEAAKARIELSHEKLIDSNKELYMQKEALEEALKQLHDAQVQLIQSEKMASLGVLVAGVAHEINNPVNFISSSISGLKNNLEYLSNYTLLVNQIKKNPIKAVELIKEKEKEASFEDILEMFKRSIEIIEVGIERTTKIVRGLRSFARSDEKKLSKYDVHENIDNTLLILYNQYKNRIKVSPEYGNIPYIECYPGQINQVIMNILVNAIQAIENEGKIKITTKMYDKNSISIEIEDSGSGIPPEIVDKIFDPFYTTKEVGTGTGLGLSISYGIIQAHKGNITVESTVGEGSCFKIVLPIKQ